MPIVTKAQAKKLLQIADSDTSKDDLITSLLLPVQEFIYNYTNNPFTKPDIWVQSNTISFHKSYVHPETEATYPYAIVDENPEQDFAALLFQAGMDIYIENSRLNNGIYCIKTVNKNIITLDLLEGQELRFWDEPKFRSILITAVGFPSALKTTAAKLINHQMNKDFQNGKTSVSVGDWSESYSSSDFPQSLIRELNNWRSLF